MYITLQGNDSLEYSRYIQINKKKDSKIWVAKIYEMIW